jgi:hypothetical protein
MRNAQLIVLRVWAGLLLSGNSAYAARLINVRFESGDRVLLETYYQDDGLPGLATIWRYLGRKPIMAEASELVAATAPDPLRAELTGGVIIRVMHAGRLIAQAKVDGLTLKRENTSNAHWFLPGDEVERTARIAGLGPAPANIVWPWWITLALTGIALLSLSLLWLLIRGTRAKAVVGDDRR